MCFQGRIGIRSHRVFVIVVPVRQYTPTVVVAAKPRYGRTPLTPSHGYFSHGGSRSPSSRSRKPGHEELLRQRRQLHAAGLAVLDDLVRVVEVDDLDHRARLRRVVGDLVVVVRPARRARGQPHQRVAVGRRHVGAVEQLLVREAVPLRRELGAAGEDAGDARLADRRAHRLEPQRQRLEQLRRREHAADVVAGLEDRHRLIDDVILVGLQVLAPALLDQLDDPARIEIDAEADAAADTARGARPPAAAAAAPTARASASSSPSGKNSSGSVSLNSS